MKKVLIFFSLLVYTCLGLAQQKAPLPETKYKLAVIAHRGNHVQVPENTIAAIRAAIKSGADYVEVDLRTSRDGQMVIMHDAGVDRMTDGTGKIKDLTWNELKNLKVFDKSRPSKKTYRIPTFSEVLNTCKDKINIYLDFKDADVEETYRQIRDAGMERQVVVYVNSIPQYKDWRKTAPAIPLIISVIHEVKTKDELSFFLGQGTIEVLDNVYEKAMIETANEEGVAVWLDVQGDHEGPEIWNETLQKGVQGMQTDHPEALIRYLKKNGLRDGLGKDLAGEDPYTKYRKRAYRELKNIKYGKAPGDENMFDAYIPKEVTPNSRVIVYIHGGGWTKGDKKEFPKQLVDELVGNRGYLVVSMNYRLVKDGNNRFPAQIEDVKKALEFITANSKKYGYNGNEFALMGGSAGAHLAMLYAYGYDEKKQVKTVIDLWGPTDFTDKSVRPDGSDADKITINFLGEKDENAPIAKEASPAYRLTKETGVPTIIFHGGQDPLVKVSQAENLYKQLQELGVPAQLEIYPDEKHGVGPSAAIDVFNKTFSWLEKYYPPTK